MSSAESHLGIDLRLGCQVLRRTYNTLMKGHTDHVTLRAMMGHSDPEMTALYSHVSYEAKVQAVSALEAVLTASGGGGQG